MGRRNDDTKTGNSFTVAVHLKGIFGFYDHDKVLYGLKIRFQLKRNDNENRLLLRWLMLLLFRINF